MKDLRRCGGIDDILLSKLPVFKVTFNKASYDDEQQHQHIHSREDLVDHGRLFHSESEDT